ncbi:hypothetical protein D354_01672 [Enterococcus faecalis]|nr:hypothetical protein D354_01672 [Enterococcus faecalis]EPI33850.1 hypothetical protein D351_00581 [Enterococcus faecalis WKS-26-18-2]
MAQIKEELRNSEDKGSLGVLEYIQKHYLSAMLFMNLLPQEKRRFIH